MDQDAGQEARRGKPCQERLAFDEWHEDPSPYEKREHQPEHEAF
jgi:hypothetical protein